MGLDSDARRRGLIEYLSLNGYATMRQLAGEFDVSINTIQRDITYLAPVSYTHLDVYKRQMEA